MRHIRCMLILAAKDLRTEARTRSSTGVLVVLGILIVTVLALGLGPARATAGGAGSAAAILWVACLFAGVLCFDRTMALERHDDALAALLMAPVGPGALFGAKLLANLALLGVLACVVTPVAVLFFGLDLSSAPVSSAAVMALSLVGFAALGTLFSAVSSAPAAPAGLLGLLILPLCLPLVLVSTRQLMDRLGSQPPQSAAGFGVLIAFDVIALAAGWLLFEAILEP